MARSATPRITLHKATGQAVVRLDGRDHYLGRFGTQEARAAYDRIVAEWLANGRRLPSGGPGSGEISLNELILVYLNHADRYYVKDGKPTVETQLLRLSYRPLKRLYGTLPVRDFTPLKLKAVREAMIEAGVSRPESNRCIGRILRMVRWGVSEELIPGSVLQDLKAIEGLKRGRSAAPEPPPLGPVAEGDVQAVLKYLTVPVRAVVQLLLLTGARPSEICSMRSRGIHDRDKPVWRYVVASHKTSHHDRERVVFLGPKARAILSPWLKDADPEAFLFSPAEGRRSWAAERRAARKSKLPPSQACRKKARPRRILGAAYTAGAICTAVRRAVERYNRDVDAGKVDGPKIEHWFPYMLRHAHGTRIRREHGLEAAQVLLGHAACDVTQVYAARDEAKAVEVAERTG